MTCVDPCEEEDAYLVYKIKFILKHTVCNSWNIITMVCVCVLSFGTITVSYDIRYKDHDGLTTMSWPKSVVAESNSVEPCWYAAHSCRISQRSWGGNNVCCLHDRSFLLWSNMYYGGVILYEREYSSWRYDAWKYMLRWLRLEACCYFCCPNNLWHFVIIFR